jgi:hypothetical protein
LVELDGFGEFFELEELRCLQVAQSISVHHGALTHLLGINALRASEAAAARIEDYRETLRGHRELHLVGKGHKPATMPITAPRRGVTSETMSSMAMTLRLTDEETEALRRRAQREARSMQDVARQAVREYVENHSRAELLDQVLDEELPRYAEALERLGQ